MCNFGFDAFMIHLHDTEPLLFGFVLGFFMVAPILFFAFFINYIRERY